MINYWYTIDKHNAVFKTKENPNLITSCIGDGIDKDFDQLENLKQGISNENMIPGNSLTLLRELLHLRNKILYFKRQAKYNTMLRIELMNKVMDLINIHLINKIQWQ